jgi:AcrR family transcriptional regulator
VANVTAEEPRRKGKSGRQPGKQRPRQHERTAATRAALLDAAAHVFATEGYEAARVDRIAARAGMSKGAVYWNFDSKEDLYFALFEERVDPRIEALSELTRTASAEQSTALEISQTFHQLVARERELVLLAQEQATLAARDPKIRARYVERYRRLREGVTRAVEALHARTGVPLPMPAKDLATAYLALAQGLAETQLVEPEAIPSGLYGRMLMLVFAGAQASREES